MTTAKLLGICLHHAEKAASKAEFYRAQSTASYRMQAANNCQEWAEVYAAIAEKLEHLLDLENPRP